MSTTAQQTRTIHNVIGGEERPAASGETVDKFAPATGELLSQVARSRREDVDAAIRAAAAAQPAWARTTPVERGRILRELAKLLERDADEVARVVAEETGKSHADALGETGGAVEMGYFVAGEGRRLYGKVTTSAVPHRHVQIVRQPLGVAGLIIAANTPIANVAWKVFPALMCGNAAVLKASEDTPETALAFARLAREAGVPDGVLNVVQGLGEEAGQPLVEDERVALVSFTGSTAVGRMIARVAGERLAKVCLELGGKNPLVVAADADVDLAVEGALFSGFGSAGQRCTSLGTAFVHTSVYDEFVQKLAAAVAAAPVGDPTRDVLYGPLINESYLTNFAKWLDLVQAHHSVHGSTGTGRITAANPREGFVGDPERGLYVHPTVVAGIRSDDALYAQETFGPLVGVGAWETFDEAVDLANGHGYGLSAAIYTRDATTAFRFRERCSAGMISINNSTSGAEAHLPFGGNGLSGNGSRQSGMWVLEQFTRWQSMNWDYAGTLQKAQMDNLGLLTNLTADPDYRL
jgi:alpha-ketoglutaric semialdehyde dehydrogenase